MTKPSDEFALDRRDRAAHARIACRQKAYERHQQHARVERVGAVMLREGAAARVERLAADVVVNFLPQRLPARDRALESELLGQLDGAVESHPRHDLGIGEVLAATPNLPNPVIRLAPDLCEVIEHGALQLHGGVVRA